MADELAKVLTIPDSVTVQMGKVIEKIEEIEQASNKMATSVNEAWRKLANGDVNLFLQKLASTQSAMTAISSTNLQVDTKSISNAATDAEKMAGAMGKVAQSAQRLGTSEQLTQQIADATARYKELQAQVEKFDRQRLVGAKTDITRSMAENAKEEMRILEEQIAVWKDKLNKIEQSNTLFREQIALLNGESAEMQQSAHILSEMSAYYNEMEKSSLASANADQKKATDAEKQYNSLQSRLTTLQKKYDEIRMAQPFEGQEKAVEGYKTEISRVERELKRLEREFPNIKTFSDQTWDAKRILNYVAQVEAMQKRLRKQYDDTANAYREANLKTLNTPEGALNFASSANTYARQVKAIQFLENAYKSLGKTEADVAKKNEIARAMRELRESVREADEQMGKFKDSARGLFNYSEQLGRAFALLFSVSQIRQYIRQIREVTAEFELQRVALGSLLQSQEKANELFGQITNLAVRSPFTIKELNTYTKQLAAYNIQYENLFDTTKMLADVSAGLGVDIGRLILVFGQVKAATVLRGTEVRQFTEAGFGILGELAKYYTELEGKLVSVGDVQDRITKKMVKFADVEEIFKRVTSAGGMFYNMQEKMANTLYGKWSNLTDRIDLMLNEIGQSNKGVFNLLIDATAVLAENWEIVAVALQVALPLFAQFMISTKMASVGMTSFDRTIRIARVGLHSFGKALKTAFGPVSIAIIAIEALIEGIDYLNERQEAAVKRAEDFNRKMSVISKASAEYKEIAKAEKTANETDAQFAKRMYDEKVKSLESFRSELAEIGIEASKLPSTELLTEDQVDQEFALLQERARAWAMFGRQLNQIIGGQATGIEWGGILGDNLKTDAQELNQSYQLLNDTLLLNVNNIKNSLMALRDVVGESRVDEILKELTQKPDDDFVKYIERVHKTLNGLLILGENDKVRLDSTLGIKGSEGRNLLNNIKETGSAIRTFMSDLTSIDKEAEKSVSRLVEKFYKGSKDELKAQAEKNPIPFKAQLDTADAEAGITDFAKTYFDKRYYFHATIEVDTPKKVPADEWWKDVLPKVESLGVSPETLKSYQDLSSYVGFLSEQLEAAEAQNKKFEETTADANGAYAQATARIIEDNNKTIAQNEAIAAALGVNLRIKEQETRPDKTRNDYLKESVSLIKKMGDEYEKALDYMGEKSATTDISTRYSSLLSDLADKAGMDGTAFVANLSFDTSGIISALQKVADFAAKSGATELQQEIKEAIAELQGEEVKVEVKANVDNFNEALDNAINQYQLGKELSKLGLGVAITGVPETSLDDLRAFVEKQKQLYTDENGELAKDYVKVFEDAEKKITEMQFKETQERWKKYATLLKQSVSERIRIEQEAAKKIADVEAEGRFSRGQKDNIIGNIRKEAERELDKLAWNDFKSSGMYLDLFENLDQASGQAIDNMLAELDKLRTSLDDLPPEQLKEIINQMDKLQEIKIEKAGFGDLIKNIREGVKAARELPKLEKQLQDARDTQKGTKEQNEERQRQYDVAQKQYDLAVKTYGENSKEAKLAKNRLGIAESYLILSNEEVENGEKQITNLSEQVRIAKLQKKLANSSISEMLSTASAVGDSISNLHGALTDVFGELPTGLEDAFIYAEGLFAGIGDFEKGLSDIMSGKVLSGAINTIAGLFRTIGGLFGIGLRDTRRERDIEKEIDLIEELQKKYEDLEKSIESAYSSSTYDQAQDDAIANLEAQNKALERAQAAERDKKKTDQDRIDEWEQQKLDNLEKIAELERQAIEAYGGFGTDDNIKSAAEDFVSAWLDAFNETGNGLDALSDKMDEWLNNAIQRQLLMRLSDQYITPLLEQFDAMFSETSDQGRIMTKEEIDAWRRLYEENSKAFDDKAKAYLDALDIKPTGIESEMSGLQRGIEGVTETTAQALEALLNSMRFYVSDSNNLLRQFYMSFISADETMNPMLYELKQHTTLLNAIHTLLNSTTKMTNNNGRALKVLMM